LKDFKAALEYVRLQRMLCVQFALVYTHILERGMHEYACTPPADTHDAEKTRASVFESQLTAITLLQLAC
jgi:hypothetical protein